MMAFRKWDHSLGHDGLTAEHNAVVDAVETLAKVLLEVRVTHCRPLSATWSGPPW
jgi:hypothetical protein